VPSSSTPSGQLALGALVEHHHDVADHFEVAQFFGGDVEQHVFAAGIILGDGLGEVAAGSGEFALRAAELFQHQVGQPGIGAGNAYGVLQSFVVANMVRVSLAVSGSKRGLKTKHTDLIGQSHLAIDRALILSCGCSAIPSAIAENMR
jgi:hypothetical protein